MKNLQGIFVLAPFRHYKLVLVFNECVNSLTILSFFVLKHIIIRVGRDF